MRGFPKNPCPWMEIPTSTPRQQLQAHSGLPDGVSHIANLTHSLFVRHTLWAVQLPVRFVPRFAFVRVPKYAQRIGLSTRTGPFYLIWQARQPEVSLAAAPYLSILPISLSVHQSIHPSHPSIPPSIHLSIIPYSWLGCVQIGWLHIGPGSNDAGRAFETKPGGPNVGACSPRLCPDSSRTPQSVLARYRAGRLKLFPPLSLIVKVDPVSSGGSPWLQTQSPSFGPIAAWNCVYAECLSRTPPPKAGTPPTAGTTN